MKDNCLTGNCPDLTDRAVNRVKISEGAGGVEMQRLIEELKKHLPSSSSWKHTDNDSALFHLGDKKILFTTDSYVVTPLFFRGGNIGKIAFCGTVNDLAVMGAKPIGISLSLVLEEGFSKEELYKIMQTIGEMSRKTGIPIVTGDTKVMEKRSVDKIIINTSGIGVAEKVLDEPLQIGDQIIVSRGIGEHGAALLANRFAIETNLETDSKPLWEEINAIQCLIKQAKDITRGGLAAILNELAQNVMFFIHEEKIPMQAEVCALTKILGIDVYSLASEGAFVCFANPQNAPLVLEVLKRYNSLASIIGEVQSGKGVTVQTRFGKKNLPAPTGNLVPRIC